MGGDCGCIKDKLGVCSAPGCHGTEFLTDAEGHNTCADCGSVFHVECPGGERNTADDTCSTCGSNWETTFYGKLDADGNWETTQWDEPEEFQEGKIKYKQNGGGLLAAVTDLGTYKIEGRKFVWTLTGGDFTSEGTMDVNWPDTTTIRFQSDGQGAVVWTKKQ